MSRNGNGQYTLPAGNPVVPGTSITTDWANNTLSDIATALTGSVASDGQTPMTGNLDMSNNRIVGVTNGVNPQDAATVSQLANAAITGGTINGAVIGGTDPKDGTFENLTATVSAIVPTLPLTDSSTKAANTKFVQDLVAQGGGGGGGGATILMAFGVSKVPADLPSNGVIPANWDSPGNPKATITFKAGEGAIYNLASPSAASYNDVYSYSPVNQGWIDVGPIEGPPGPTGPAGPQGVEGPPGPQGIQGNQGVKGDTGADGPQGIQGNIGPQGPIGPQGTAGQSVIIVGSFGASKTPADLPVDGLIPANWDSTGNPPTQEQLVIGQGLIYNEGVNTDPLYGNVYAYVGTGFDANGWVNCGKVQGPKGDTGAQGPQGIPGNPGTDGQQGPQGPQGIQGVKGDTGAQGPQGPAGPAGPSVLGNAASFVAGAGDAPGTTFDGSVARQIGHGTVGAPSTAGVGATGTWNISIAGVAQGGATITSNQVTTALGFVPYSNSNPSGFTTLSAVAAQGYTTQSWVQSQGYVTSSGLANYVTLNSAQTITGTKTYSTAPTYSAGINSNIVNAPGGTLSFTCAGVNKVAINNANLFFPNTDNQVSCGSGGNKWTAVYAVNGTIQTSDANAKTDITDFTEAEIAVGKELRTKFKSFRFNNAVLVKGQNNARIHFGIIAQTVEAVFAAHGLNANDYGVFCRDTWYEVDGKSCNDQSEMYTKDSPGAVEVTGLSVRYDELFSLILGSI